MEYLTRDLVLPGLVLRPGMRIVVVDSRGRTVMGIFLGYRSSFIALGNEDCKPQRFLNIKRVNEIIVIEEAVCNGKGGKSEENRGTKASVNG